MKQKYVKPRIIVEHFILTQNIASGCQGVQGGMAFENIGPTQWHATTCTWNQGGVEFFIEGRNCANGPESPDAEFDFDGYCYNNPTEAIQMFSS